jgi:hypothetical protein
VPRLSFQTSLLLAPLAYAIHHGEEHLLLNFRAWRLRHFPDNNALTTETVLAILMGITMVYLFLHATIRTRASAWAAITFLMATQVHNTIYHLGGSVLFADFSPGLITAVALYLPVNILIARAALAEKWVTKTQLVLLFVGGGALFWAFEFIGPAVLLASTLALWVWAISSARRPEAREARHQSP